MVFCSRCGNEEKSGKNFCSKCGSVLAGSAQEASRPYQTRKSRWWYLLPIFLNVIGGIIAYLVLKDDDRALAKNCLYLGIILTVIGFVIGMIFGIISAAMMHY